MVAVPLGLSSYRRRGARTPEIALVNMMVEKDPTNQVDGLVRFQRPGLAAFTSIGTGRIRGIFRRYGVLGSRYIVVSGASAYIVTEDGTATRIGEISGLDLVCIDGSEDRVIIVADGIAYSTDGSTLTTIAMPDSVGVSSVAYIGGYFVLVQITSQRFWWLAPGDLVPDALSFASAENAPDNIVRVIRLLDELWFFGQQTTEVFQLTGSLDAPFQPVLGRLYEKGCANKDTAFVLDNTLFWVGNDFIVYRADTTPVRISDHSMEERLRLAGADDLRAWAFALDGHTVYCVRAGDVGTFNFDVESSTWGRFKSHGQEAWRAHIGTQVSGDAIVAGDDRTGALWLLDPEQSNDDGDPLERELTGGITVIGSPQKCKSLELVTAVGWADITGDATNPLVQMRFSDDGGNLWSSWIEMPLGLQGKYKTEVTWRRLGIMTAPGRIFTFRMTDDAIFRVSYARINEASSV